MVVVKKKPGESTDTLFHRFGKHSRDEDIKWDVERKDRHMRRSDVRLEKSKRKMRRKAQQRRRRMLS